MPPSIMHTRLGRRAAALSLAAALAAALPAAAQEAPGETPLRRGARSLMLSVSPDVELGYWGMTSDRTAVGLVGSAYRISSTSGDSESRQTSLAFGPQVKRYAAGGGAVLPYLHGAAAASVFDSDGSSGTSQRATVLSASAAVGLDWFPAGRFSLGGHAGLALGRLANEMEVPIDVRRESTVWALRTFTAAIRVHLYL